MKIFNIISKVTWPYKSILRSPYVFASAKSKDFSQTIINAMSPAPLMVLATLMMISTYTQNASIVLFLLHFP